MERLDDLPPRLAPRVHVFLGKQHLTFEQHLQRAEEAKSVHCEYLGKWRGVEWEHEHRARGDVGCGVGGNGL